MEPQRYTLHITERPGMLMARSRGQDLFQVTIVCLPDTIDPRGPKR